MDKQVRRILESAAKALRPLAGAVYNDNGDMEIGGASPTSDDCVAAYFARKEIEGALREDEPQRAENRWTCRARFQSLPEPAECNWPGCGCDPKATEVIDHFAECGLTLAKDGEVDTLRASLAEAEKQRDENFKWAQIIRGNGRMTESTPLSRALDALQQTERERDEARQERDGSLARLPEGMKNCTILFKECELGHGWLTSTNWVQYPCPVCEQKAIEAKLSDARKVLKAYEAWEASLILEGDWNGELPRMTQTQFDRLLEIQAMRNEAFAKIGDKT